MTGGEKFSIMITIQRRYNRKRYKDADDDWSLDTIYSDGMEGGEQREKDYAEHMKTKDDGVYEYKITVE
ncbi:uncharacterized protein METZ01_LOCUS311109 [marine metagenome]|uniref:Uncharacterized protein n=1 Tax=marine metagenome TaxID=408172 RepID=A0A382ND54_9ZZZZ